MLTESDIKTVISQTYADTALRLDTDMRLVADVFEAVRRQLYASPGLFDVWDYLMTSDTKAATLASALFTNTEDSESKASATGFAADLEDVIVPLIWLREALFAQLIKKQIAKLDELFTASAHDFTKTWEQYYADAAIHFRDDFICMLCRQRGKWDNDAQAVKHLSKLTRLIHENRWVDAFPHYKAIAENDDIDIKTRTAAYVVLAEIIIFYYPDPTQAEPYIAKADELMPGASPVKRARSQLFLKNGDFQSTKSILLDVVYNKPSDFMALIFAGDCFIMEELLQQAECWYLDALQKNALQTETYRRLINLYGNPRWFAEKHSRINDLLERLGKRRPFCCSDLLINEGFATADCFKHTELYHAYRDVASGFYANAAAKESEVPNQQDAIGWYLSAINLQPSLAAARIDLAYTYIAINNLPEAKTQLDEALAIDGESFDVHWALAYYFEKTAQQQNAFASYQTCLQLRPEWSDWTENLIGNLYFAFKDFETAATYFRSAGEKNKNLPVYRQNLASALTNIAVACEEKNTNADNIKAASYYREAAVVSGMAKDWNRLGNFYFGKEEWHNAIGNYVKAVSINDKEPVYYGNVAAAYERLNNTDEAIAWYRKAIDANTASAEYYNRLGLVYYFMGELENAIGQYKPALEREPENTDYLSNICLAYKDLEQYETGEAYYVRLADKEPGNDMAQNILGIIYYRKGKYDKAAEYYKKAIEINNREPVYFENLWLLYNIQERFADAADVLQRALALAPGNDTLWNNLGVMYYSLGNDEKAIESYNKAIEINNSLPVYFSNIGQAYEKNKDMEKANEAYQRRDNLS